MFDPQVDGAALAGCLKRYQQALAEIPQAKHGTPTLPGWLPAVGFGCLTAGAGLLLAGLVLLVTSVKHVYPEAAIGAALLVVGSGIDSWRAWVGPAKAADVTRVANEVVMYGLSIESAPRSGQTWSERDLAPWREVVQARTAWIGAARDLGLENAARQLAWQFQTQAKHQALRQR